ncbi:MAG TPA: hypothetical protein VIE65_18330 [Methylobacter sp.]
MPCLARVTPVGRNKPVRATARIGVSGKHHPNSPETPPRATRLDGLIPAYEVNQLAIHFEPRRGRTAHHLRMSEQAFGASH